MPIITLLGCNTSLELNTINKNPDEISNNIAYSNVITDSDEQIAYEGLFKEGALINDNKPKGLERIDFGNTRWTNDININCAILCAVVSDFHSYFKIPDDIIDMFFDILFSDSALFLYHIGEEGAITEYSIFEESSKDLYAIENIEVMFDSKYTVKINYKERNPIPRIYDEDFINSVVSKVKVKYSNSLDDSITEDSIKQLAEDFVNDYRKYYYLCNVLDRKLTDSKNNTLYLLYSYNFLRERVLYFIKDVNKLQFNNTDYQLRELMCQYISIKYHFDHYIKDKIVANYSKLTESYVLDMDNTLEAFKKLNTSNFSDNTMKEYLKLSEYIESYYSITKNISVDYDVDVLRELIMNCDNMVGSLDFFVNWTMEKP